MSYDEHSNLIECPVILKVVELLVVVFNIGNSCHKAREKRPESNAVAVS